MPSTWLNALNSYNYQVDLSQYHYAGRFPGFFGQEIQGDRPSTILFEDYFRANNGKIQTWYEVVFWKMYSQSGRRDQKTTDVINQLNGQLKNTNLPMTTSSQLIAATKAFIDNPDVKDNFENLRKLFRFESSVIAIVATFPAFVNPEKFPIVDTRVAKWIDSHLDFHNKNDPLGPQLVRSYYGKGYSTVLTMADFDFYLHWIHWTRYMAEKLSKRTSINWRARDVEMAVFTAWGDRELSHPRFHLNPI